MELGDTLSHLSRPDASPHEIIDGLFGLRRMAAEAIRAIPTPEDVNQGIIDLTDETFGRLGPRLTAYSKDPRRVHEDTRRGTEVALTVSTPGTVWDDGVHGNVMIRIADRASYQAVGRLVLGDVKVKNAQRDSSHQALVEQMTWGDSEDQQRLRLRGQYLVLHVLKDGYPRGNIEARDSLMKQAIDPSADWGARHKVGVEIIRLYNDRLFPRRLVDWRFAMYLEKRFDEPAAQFEVTSRFDGFIDSRDVIIREFKPVMSDTRHAHKGDLATMANIFHTAKDIRPEVDRLPVLLKGQEVWAAMVDNFYQGKPIGSVQNEAA